MFSFLFRKEQRVEELIHEYLEVYEQVRQNFYQALHVCVGDPLCPDFDFLIRQTHKHESRADDIRDELVDLMYGKALIPDSRGDVIGLLAALETIPALFEQILHMIQTQRLMIPPFLMSDLEELVRVSLECCDLMVRQVRALFGRQEGIRALATRIDSNESHCDHMQRRIITRLFDSDEEPFEKLQLKDLVTKIGYISDQADIVSKRVNVMSMKRRV